MIRPEQFTEGQWRDICDWFESGFRAGFEVGVRTGESAAYDRALGEWAAMVADWVPRTAWGPAGVDRPASRELGSREAGDEIRRKALESWGLDSKAAAA